MNVLHVATDVVREAFARKFILAVMILIFFGLMGLTAALELEVVEGALAAGRLFGLQVTGGITAIDVALRPIFQALIYGVFYIGLLFGIVATSDIASKLLAPGRVEHLLALPLRRWELIVGTYLGVLGIAAIGTGVTIGGVSLVLFWKAGFFTLSPAIGAGMAVLAFMAIYAVMLVATTLVRSAALAAGAGMSIFLFGVITSDREAFASIFRDGAMRTVVEWGIAAFPRFHALAKFGAEASGGESVLWTPFWPLAGATVAFAVGLVAAACFVVQGRDY